MFQDYLPQKVNSGPWATAYTLHELRRLPGDTEFILPICSLVTPYREITQLGRLILPPLYHEALDDDLKSALIDRICTCFPHYNSTLNRKRVRIVELPPKVLPVRDSPLVLSFSVDTAIEEHGPHLPLGTDTIQSYSLLRKLAAEFENFEIARPVDYGQLTWGLPFGFSIDITAPLLTRYVTNYCNALQDWCNPGAMYVVDVHGSITHRQAIIEGIANSRVDHWAFRWLYDPLAEFTFARSDQHAGGVETILVEHVNRELLDPEWWPDRMEEIAERQMPFLKAVELTPHLDAFCAYVAEHEPNGVIGEIANYNHVDVAELLQLKLERARRDVRNLLAGNSTQAQQPGLNLW